MTLPVLANDPGLIEQAADPGAFVVLACERAKIWLTQALEQGEIEQIIELKSQAEAIRVYTAQKQIGKDAELAAAEIVRRAERGIGIAVRRGQETGEIRLQGSSGGPARPYQVTRHGRPTTVNPKPRVDGEDITKMSGATIFSHSHERRDAYLMTDGVSNEEFETALTAARSEGNLSRTNVVRKVQTIKSGETTWDLSTRQGRIARIAELAAQNYTARQISEMVGVRDDNVRLIAREQGFEIPADKVVYRSRKHDSSRIVEQTVHALDGLRMGVELIDYNALDPQQVSAWSSSLTQSLRSLNQFARKIKELNKA